MSTTKSAKNVNQLEVELGDGDCDWADFSSPVSIMHVTSNARTLPSSHGSSSGSMRSGGASDESSLEPPPPQEQDNDVDDDDDDAKTGWTTNKIVLVALTFLLLFAAGILGGLLATGGFSSRNEAVPASTENDSTVADGETATTSPGIVIEVFDEPTLAPIESSVSTPPPTNKPTNKPTTGTYDYRANSEFLVGA